MAHDHSELDTYSDAKGRYREVQPHDFVCSRRPKDDWPARIRIWFGYHATPEGNARATGRLPLLATGEAMRFTGRRGKQFGSLKPDPVTSGCLGSRLASNLVTCQTDSLADWPLSMHRASSRFALDWRSQVLRARSLAFGGSGLIWRGRALSLTPQDGRNSYLSANGWGGSQKVRAHGRTAAPSILMPAARFIK